MIRALTNPVHLAFILLVFLMKFNAFSNEINNEIIIDSKMTFKESIEGTNAPDSVIANLILLDVQYYSFDGKLHQGQIVIHKDLKNDVHYIFDLIKSKKFPIAKVIPIVKYNWSDNASMEDNNTSAFNYRTVAGTTRVSKHSYGIAIDFNPIQNPAVYNDGTISPKGAKYDKKAKGTITSTTFVTIELKKRGWIWGGDWNSLKDYQHFEKKLY